MLLERGVSFDEIIQAISDGNLLDVRNHYNQKKYPNQSPYSAFDNSPIYKNDPNGTSGIVTIDKQSKTL